MAGHIKTHAPCGRKSSSVRYKEYRLDADQQRKTRALLARRNAFLALLDGTTHPSLRASHKWSTASAPKLLNKCRRILPHTWRESDHDRPLLTARDL